MRKAKIAIGSVAADLLKVILQLLISSYLARFGDL
jgi:hypothetical protein